MLVLPAILTLFVMAAVAGTPPEAVLTGDIGSRAPRSVASVSRLVDHRPDGLRVANESTVGVAPGVFGALDPGMVRPLTVLSEAEQAIAASHVDQLCPDHEPCGP